MDELNEVGEFDDETYDKESERDGSYYLSTLLGPGFFELFQNQGGGGGGVSRAMTQDS